MIAKNALMKNLISLDIKKDGVSLYSICQLEATTIPLVFPSALFLNPSLHSGFTTGSRG